MSSGSPSTSGAGGGPGSGGGGGPCGACKFLRRKCVAGCIFAPYFDSEQGAAHFAAVHKVFGASNVSKLLLHIPPHKRPEAVITICYEAQSRLRDPVYGCVSHIFALQQQVINLQAELAYLQAHLATLEVQPPPPPPHHSMLVPPAVLNMADLPAGGTSMMMPPVNDLSSQLFDYSMAQHSPWNIHHHQRPPDPRHTRVGPTEVPSSSSGGGGGDLQELARELMHRHGLGGSSTVPCTAAPPHSS
ncbi:unnamed protein product [Cuscuta campestris]|uniref:LOB domain-containing protein n=1 Tax=Cuscuta campestris TaxID=132261 RepID=A0A484MU16_9ASTE|nr:unnamed protein product [Cuscuta campestris]